MNAHFVCICTFFTIHLSGAIQPYLILLETGKSKPAWYKVRSQWMAPLSFYTFSKPEPCWKQQLRPTRTRDKCQAKESLSNSIFL